MCLALDSTVCFRRKLARANQRLSSLRLEVELPPEWNGQNLLTPSVFAWLKRQRLAEDKGPRQQLRRLKNSLEAGWIERGGERGIRHRGGSKMDPINTDRCVKKGPG
jgi:hypothetical protein